MTKTFIHETAIVDQPCEIGEGTKIWHFCHLMTGCRIGERCILGQSVFVGSRAVVGNGVKVQNNVSIYDDVEIEDDVFLGPSMVFTNVSTPRAHVERKDQFARTLVRRGATIGANATIVCGHTIGEYAFIGAGSVVTKDVPDHALVVGNPAKSIGWMCRCGERLPVNLVCRACGDSYALTEEAICLKETK
ncbi:MAG: N-acetyltransferase [Deltaproteobacteria bacterium]|nr:N-acetyltransferase [Deltaproteobacteria bacterium]